MMFSRYKTEIFDIMKNIARENKKLQNSILWNESEPSYNRSEAQSLLWGLDGCVPVTDVSISLSTPWSDCMKPKLVCNVHLNVVKKK